MISSWNKFRTKWQSTSICFARSWYTGFEAIRIALILGHREELDYNKGYQFHSRDLKSCSETISLQTDDIARYSASVEDLNKVSCFLCLQETRESPRTTPSNCGSATQSAFIGFKLKGGTRRNNNPLLLVPLMYLLIRWTAVRCDCLGAETNCHYLDSTGDVWTCDLKVD